eukprot:Gb_08930 [translate_table: standard]
MEFDDIGRVENSPLEQGEMPLRRNRQREAGGPLEFEREANQDRNNLKIETPKFVNKDDGMDVLIKICELRQHFKQYFMGKDEQRGSYEKEEESRTFVPLPSDATKQANLSSQKQRGSSKANFFTSFNGTSFRISISKAHNRQQMLLTRFPELHMNEHLHFSSRARDNMEPPVQGRRNFHGSGLPAPIAQQGPISGGGSAIQFQQTWSPSIATQIQYSAHSSQYIIQQSNGVVKITHPETHEELKLDSNGKRLAWFPKTLWIDDHKSVNCDDGQSILTVDTVAFDPSGINYDSPFVLTVGTMDSDTRVCDLRVPTLGTMVIGAIAIDSNILDLDMYRYLEEEGQRIKEKPIGPDCLDLELGKIQLIFGIPEQCQAGFMLEDFGIIDNRGMVMSACGEVLNELPHGRNFIPIDHPPTVEDIDPEFFPTLPPECIMGLDIETELVLGFLKYHMLGTPVASLRKIHLENGLGDAIVGGGIKNKLVQPQFIISLKSVAKHDEKRVEDLTMQTLKMIVDEGAKVLQLNLFTNDVFYTEIAFDMRSLRSDLLPLVESSKFELLLPGTTDAILLIEGYSDILTEELLLQVVDIRQVEELADSGLIEAQQSQSKMPPMKAISSLGKRVLTVFFASRKPLLQLKKLFPKNPLFTFNALRAKNS